MLLDKSLFKATESPPHGPRRAGWTLAGLVGGIACGLIFGEYCAPLSVVGDVFIGLLQMTVLPYMVVVLIANFGRLSLEQSRRLGLVGGLVLLVLWSIGLVTLFIVPSCFPDWKAGSFYSAAMTDPPRSMNLVELFVPTNIVAALAENRIPAVVLLCISIGLALTRVAEKRLLVEQLDVLAKALMRVSSFVARWAPIGVFAIAASTGGTLSWAETGRMQAYFVSFTATTLFLMCLVLPALVATCTSFSYADVWRVSRVAMLTAFATGKLIVVLPILIDETDRLFVRDKDSSDPSTAPVIDVLYPVAYPFPHLGKLMGMLFIPFAAWFLGRELQDHEYPAFLFSGLLSYFAGPLLATPFLLDQMHLPHDMFPLFVLSGVYCGRLGDALGVMHLVTFTLITTSVINGTLSLSVWRIARYVALISAVGLLMIIALRLGLASSLKYVEVREDTVAQMQLLEQTVESVVLMSSQPNPDPLRAGETLLRRIRRRGVIRIGFNEDKLPFAYFNSRGQLVGLDINLAHQLARDLNVSIEFVRFDRSRLAEQMRDDHFDIVMSGLTGTAERSEAMQHTDIYMDVTMAIVAPDYRIRDFASIERIEQQGSLRIGFVDANSSFAERFRELLPNVELVEIDSNGDYFDGDWKRLDALLISAESGSAFTLMYPDFEVVVPTGAKVSMPLFYAVGQREEEMTDYLEHWVQLRKRDGTMQQMYDYWILGKRPGRPEPRWSLIRHLGWVP
jgi:Na+/H+-dicarboxylate symporter/ABC-type amino acid transport substrate-binding protein